MISKVSLVLILTSYCLIGLSHSVHGGCRNVGSTTLDEKWFDKISSTSGWEVLVAGEIKPLESLPQLPSIPEGLKKKRCYTVQVKTSVGLILNVPGTCQFNRISESYCSLDTKGTTLDNILLFHPNNNVILTDNQHYVFIVSCVNGAYEWWAVFIVRGTTLDSAEDEKIQAKIKKLKLVKSSGKDQIAIAGLKTTKGGCNGKDYIGHGLDLIDVGLTLDALKL